MSEHSPAENQSGAAQTRPLRRHLRPAARTSFTEPLPTRPRGHCRLAAPEREGERSRVRAGLASTRPTSWRCEARRSILRVGRLGRCASGASPCWPGPSTVFVCTAAWRALTSCSRSRCPISPLVSSSKLGSRNAAGRLTSLTCAARSATSAGHVSDLPKGSRNPASACGLTASMRQGAT
jgi:hypothetical protein